MIGVDNTVLTNFALIGRFDLLRQAVETLDPCTTPAVKKEFDAGVEAGLFVETNIGWLPIVSLTLAERNRVSSLLQQLDDGEAECVAVVLERGGILASDDLKARNLVLQSGGVVTGTVGILKSLVDANHLSAEEGDRVLTAMRNEGYFSPVTRLTEIL